MKTLIHPSFQGPILPAMQNLFLQWAIPNERNRFMGSIMGGSFGVLVSVPLCWVLIEYMGWPSVFHATSLLAFVAAFLWWCFVSDTLEEHPSIKEEEKNVIREALGSDARRSREPLPLKVVLKSPAFWSLLLLHFGFCWGDYFFSLETKNFFNEGLGFNSRDSGLLTLIPFLGMVVFTFLVGSLVDQIKIKGGDATRIVKYLSVLCKYRKKWSRGLVD